MSSDTLKASIVVGAALAVAALTNIQTEYNNKEPHAVVITRIIDGDTVEISAPGLPEGLPKKLLLRIRGIDTPEKGGRAKCTEEAHRAQLARAHLENSIATSKKRTVIIESWDKYGGRVLGDIDLDGRFVSSLMIERGYAIKYDGEKKSHDWCQ